MDLRRPWTELNQEVHNKTCDNPSKHNAVITPKPVKRLDKLIHIDDDLADLGCLPEALHPDNKQDKQINTPVLSGTPMHEWITIDQLRSPDNIDYDLQAV